MWIEYGCNNIGLEACWVRPQSSHYLLPPTANKLVTGDVAPFHKWAKAKTITPPADTERPTLTTAEALKAPGERVVVQFAAKSYGTTVPSGHVELFSEANRSVEGCLTLRLLKSELGKFPTQDPKALFDLYRGKELRVRGSVQPISMAKGVHLVIEVGDPEQIELVK
jgi:hypothetical protein